MTNKDFIHKITILDIDRDDNTYRNTIKSACCMTLNYEGVDTLCVVNVLITDDSGIRKYNRDYRNIDNATDVLSFPMQVFEKAGWSSHSVLEFDEDTGELPLGDIVISAESVKRQAEEFENTIEYETAYLIIHSVLHLLGYDHFDQNSEKDMHTGTKKIINEMGFKSK